MAPVPASSPSDWLSAKAVFEPVLIPSLPNWRFPGSLVCWLAQKVEIIATVFHSSGKLIASPRHERIQTESQTERTTCKLLDSVPAGNGADLCSQPAKTTRTRTISF